MIYIFPITRALSSVSKKRKSTSRSTGRLSLEQYEAEVSASPLFDVLSVREIIEEFKVNASTTVVRAIECLRLPARKLDAEIGAKGGTYIIMRYHAERLWSYRDEEKI